jgi:hypothetical protein
VDGTGSGSCPMAGFGISGVETSDSATREFTGLLICQSASQTHIQVVSKLSNCQWIFLDRSQSHSKSSRVKQSYSGSTGRHVLQFSCSHEYHNKALESKPVSM